MLWTALVSTHLQNELFSRLTKYKGKGIKYKDKGIKYKKGCKSKSVENSFLSARP